MPAQLALLDRLTIIIEGPYLPGRRVGIRWRGSSNQRIHLLGGGHAEVRDARDEPAG